MTASLVDNSEFYGSNAAGGVSRAPTDIWDSISEHVGLAGGTPGDLSDDPRNRWKRGLRAVSGALVGPAGYNYSISGGVGRI